MFINIGNRFLCIPLYTSIIVVVHTFINITVGPTTRLQITHSPKH